MGVTEMLVIWEVYQVCLFSPYRYFTILWDLYNVNWGRTLNDLQIQDSIKEISLELIRPHLKNHVLC